MYLRLRRVREKCPRKVADAFNEGLNKRKAVYVKYPQAVPLKYAIDEEHCIYFEKHKCRACEKFCPAGAIDLGQQEQVHRLEVGAVILSPGFQAVDPSTYGYGYGNHPNVVTSKEFERLLSAWAGNCGPSCRPSDGAEPTKNRLAAMCRIAGYPARWA